MPMDERMNKDQKSLLLYLETRAVDYGGVDTAHMNDVDLVIAKEWDKSGYIIFTRFKYESCTERRGSYYIELSDKAFNDAAQLRKERAQRNSGRYKDLTKRFEETPND